MEQYRKSPRAKFLNYDAGDFFITICTHNKQHFFGEIENSEMRMTPIGKFVDEKLRKCNEICSNIHLPLYVVMPNHIHFIVHINKNPETGNGYEQRTPNPALRDNPTSQRHIPTLSKYISSLKSTVTKHAKSLGWEFGWQARYHDHLIRGDEDGKRISEYIANNVARWQEDCFNVK